MVLAHDPTQHATDHEQQRDSIGFWLIHGPPGSDQAPREHVFQRFQLLASARSIRSYVAPLRSVILRWRLNQASANRSSGSLLRLRNPDGAQIARNAVDSGRLIGRKAG